jgi:hypothetical protein
MIIITLNIILSLMLLVILSGFVVIITDEIEAGKLRGRSVRHLVIERIMGFVASAFLLWKIWRL